MGAILLLISPMIQANTSYFILELPLTSVHAFLLTKQTKVKPSFIE